MPLTVGHSQSSLRNHGAHHRRLDHYDFAFACSQRPMAHNLARPHWVRICECDPLHAHLDGRRPIRKTGQRCPHSVASLRYHVLRVRPRLVFTVGSRRRSSRRAYGQLSLRPAPPRLRHLLPPLVRFWPLLALDSKQIRYGD